MESRSAIAHHKYLTLDGIRGVAALMVVLRHTGNFFGDIKFTESYLAVDLFFVLSGFVIAAAYNNRLAAGLSPIEFMRIRLVRLYPLYLLGSVLGIAYMVGTAALGEPSEGFAPYEFAISATAAILMIPSPLTLMLYPINAPSWSLLFELFSNAIYAFFYPAIANGKMIVVVGISAIALCICVYQIGNLDAGFYWKDIYIGIPRVLFSFGAGILVYTFRLKHDLKLPSWVLIAVVFVILSADPSTEMRPWFDIVAVVILFPAIVYVAAATEPKYFWLKKSYAVLGATSYGIYVLHVPLAELITVAFSKGVTTDVAQFAPYIGLALLLFLVSFTWWVDKYYDRPVRRMASKYFSA